MNYDDESDHGLIYEKMLEYMLDRSQSNTNFNKRVACYKTSDNIKQGQLEWKGGLKATQNIGKCLHTVFHTVLKEISQELAPLGESGSEVSYFIPEPRNFAEVTNFVRFYKETLAKGKS